MKVLLSGDINGKWNTLFKRVSAVNKSNGPFDVLLCTGRTFADAGETTAQPAHSLPICTIIMLPCLPKESMTVLMRNCRPNRGQR